MIAQILPIYRFEKIREEYKNFVPQHFKMSSIVSLEDDINWIID
jgi:hypothetical protein